MYLRMFLFYTRASKVRFSLPVFLIERTIFPVVQLAAR